MYQQFRDVVKVKTLFKILNDIPSSLHNKKPNHSIQYYVHLLNDSLYCTVLYIHVTVHRKSSF